MNKIVQKVINSRDAECMAVKSRIECEFNKVRRVLLNMLSSLVHSKRWGAQRSNLFFLVLSRQSTIRTITWRYGNEIRGLVSPCSQLCTTTCEIEVHLMLGKTECEVNRQRRPSKKTVKADRQSTLEMPISKADRYSRIGNSARKRYSITKTFLWENCSILFVLGLSVPFGIERH